MLYFLGRRLLLLLVTLLFSSFVIFAALQLAPGDPLASITGSRTVSPEVQETLRQQYHLDDGFFAQYWNWLTGVLHGDFGTSIALHSDVRDVIANRAPVTIELVLYSSIIILAVGIPLGVLAGTRPGTWDVTVVAATTVLAAVPSFVASVFLLLFFSVNLGWFPALGEGGSGLLDRVHHLTLPALALALPSVGLVARMTRVSVAKEAEAEHVQTATSRGITRRRILGRHVMRNAAIPITTVAGVALIAQIALSAVVERAFGLNGLGSTLVNAASSKDLVMVQGISLVLVTAFVICNMLIDLLYALLDPRVSATGARP